MFKWTFYLKLVKLLFFQNVQYLLGHRASPLFEFQNELFRLAYYPRIQELTGINVLKTGRKL